MQVGAFLVSELDSIISRIRGSWNVEHKDDDTHGNVHADSLATGRLTFSDIATATINQAQVDNYNPGGLGTAALLRLSGTGSGGTNPVITITGITVPQDESGTIIDGRVLVIENASDRTQIALSHEDTFSTAQNRFTLPFNTPITELAASTQVIIQPKGLQIIIYNSAAARWMVHNPLNDNIISTYSSAGSDNDLNPAGFVACGTLKVDKTAAGQTISGFETSNISAYARKRIVNSGLYAFEILHANTSSVDRNRVYCPGQIRYRVHPREAVDLFRQVDGGWRLVASSKADQWIDVTYAAGNFTTNTGTWTVGSGDQTTYCYQIDGNKMVVSFDIRTTTVASSPVELRIAIPGGRTAARTITIPVVAINAGAQISTAFARVTAGNAYIQIFRDGSSTAWSAAADTTYVMGEITFMIQDASASISEPHTDVAHGDTSHSDAAHSDIAHSDVAHGDSHSDTSHSDIAHSDVAHVDTSSHSDTHSDTAHSDTAHSDVAHVDTHSDSFPHTDNFLPPSDPAHADSSSHADGHGDVTHVDTAHSDTAHADSHSDTTSHSDTAHSDTAHVDSGHGDSHSDTVPHSDIAHVDAAHGDTAHADNIHQDVGFHNDTTHVDI